MIKVVQGDRQTCQSFVEDLKSRVGQASPEIEQTVRDVIEQVRAGGDSAVKAFSEKFDGWTPENLEMCIRDRCRPRPAPRECPTGPG